MNHPPDDRLLANYLSGECSEEEFREMELWLKSNPEYRETLQGQKKIWFPEKRQPHLWDKTRLWLKIRDAAGVQQIPLPKKSRPRLALPAGQSRLVLTMASALLTLSIGLFTHLITNDLNPDGDRVTITVKHGTQEDLILNDGTVVTLDAGSSFSYPTQFAAKKREVELYGEGYFEVVPDASRPFIVRTEDAVVQVLGTRFTVRSWEPDRAVRVVVAEGKVALQPARGHGGDAMIITGGQTAAVLKDGGILTPRNVDVSNYLGWLDNNLEFDNVSLQEILFHLERWYNVKFVVDEPILAKERLTLHTQQKSIEPILEMIALLTDLQYDRSEDTIHLTVSD